MIAVTEYDAQVDRDMIHHCDGSATFISKEPVATIHLTVLASGKDLDKFMDMLYAITGQVYQSPASRTASKLGGAEIVPA